MSSTGVQNALTAQLFKETWIFLNFQAMLKQNLTILMEKCLKYNVSIFNINLILDGSFYK